MAKSAVKKRKSARSEGSVVEESPVSVSLLPAETDSYTHPIAAALRGELMSLVASENFNAQTLAVIRDVAEKGVELLGVVDTDPLSAVAASRRLRPRGTILSDGTSVFEPPVLSPSPMSESFGGKILREVLPALQKLSAKKRSATDLVRAIREAKEAKLPKAVVDQLMSELVDGEPDNTVIAGGLIGGAIGADVDERVLL